MASPFHIFRKNQKLWLAGLTILAIGAFVFITPMMSMVGSLGAGREPVVVRTKYGNLTQSQITSLRRQRYLLLNFLTRLEQAAGTNQQAMMGFETTKILLGQETPDEAVNRWVFARTAESMGIATDDKSVNDFLTMLTSGLQDPQKLIVAALGDGMSTMQLMGILREQLLALRLMQIGHFYDDWAGFSATPGERWDFFKRLNQKASIEVALFSPQDFVKEIKDPSDETLKQFFEQHKQIEGSPDSPTPGFRVPRRVKVQYLEANPLAYEARVTEDEITQEYEKDPKKYARDMEDFEKDEKREREARAKEEKEEAAAPKSDEKKAEKAPKKKPESEPKKSEPKQDVKPEPKSEPPKPEVKPEPKTEPKPEVKPDAGKTSEPPKPASTGAKPAGSSSAAPRSPFRLVAFADDKKADNSPPAATPDKKDADKKDVVAKPEDKKPANDAKTPAQAEKKPADDKKLVDDKKPADAKKLPDEKKAASETGKKAGETTVTKVVRLPIKTAQERLRDMIRGELADRKFQDAISKIKAQLDNYHSQWVSYPDAHAANPDLPAPTPPDFAALAKEYSMTANQTGSVSGPELYDTELGKSELISGDLGRRSLAVSQLFGPTALYKVDTSSTPERIRYIFWKTDDQPGGVPKWEDADIKTKVSTAWKLVQGRKLARDAADKLKAQASASSGKSLKELAAGKKEIEVLKPSEFTWLSSMFSGSPPSISVVGDLTHVGPDFMQKVFSLSPNQVDVASNTSKSEFYVVRMVETTPFKELWEKFTTEETARDFMSVLVGTIRNEVAPAWRQKVLDDAGVTREKQPSQGPAPIQDEPEGPPPPEDY